MERKDSAKDAGGSPSDCYLAELHKQVRATSSLLTPLSSSLLLTPPLLTPHCLQLAQLIGTKPGQKPGAMEDECEDPKAQPITWVSKVGN